MQPYVLIQDLARETPEIPNQKTTCSSGDAWPVLSRSWTNSRIFSAEIVPSRISPHTSPGVFGV